MDEEPVEASCLELTTTVALLGERPVASALLYHCPVGHQEKEGRRARIEVQGGG